MFQNYGIGKTRTTESSMKCHVCLRMGIDKDCEVIEDHGYKTVRYCKEHYVKLEATRLNNQFYKQLIKMRYKGHAN